MVDLAKYKRVLVILPGVREKNVTDHLVSKIAKRMSETLGGEWVPLEVFQVPAMTYSEVDDALSLTDITLRITFVRKPKMPKTKPRRSKPRP